MSNLHLRLQIIVSLKAALKSIYLLSLFVYMGIRKSKNE